MGSPRRGAEREPGVGIPAPPGGRPVRYRWRVASPEPCPERAPDTAGVATYEAAQTLAQTWLASSHSAAGTIAVIFAGFGVSGKAVAGGEVQDDGSVLWFAWPQIVPLPVNDHGLHTAMAFRAEEGKTLETAVTGTGAVTALARLPAG